MISLVGSLLWPSQSICPDLSTITSLLTQYQAKSSFSHIRAVKYSIRYLKGSKKRGLSFLAPGIRNWKLISTSLCNTINSSHSLTQTGVPKTNLSQILLTSNLFHNPQSDPCQVFAYHNGPLTLVAKIQRFAASSSVVKRRFTPQMNV